MKKFVSLVLALVLALSMTACGQTRGDDPAPVEDTPAEKVTIRLGGLKGPTSMGMVKLLADAEEGLTANDYTFTMAASAPDLTPQFIKGELDILAVPVNLGATLYANTDGGVMLLAASTLGVLYIVERGDTVESFADLAGRTVYATGKGTTPEYALTYLLAQNGLTLGEDVTVEWKSEPTEVVAQMAQEEGAVAMLPQPFVTVAQGQVEGLRVALDLSAQWDGLDNDSRLVTAGLLVRREFAEAHPDAVAKFLEEYAASVDYVNENPAEAAVLVEAQGIVKAAVAEKAIPYCSLVCITGADMKTAVSGYLQTLYDLKPETVGGAMPDDGFYWMGT